MRKHNRNIVVKFPSLFTIDDLKEKNPTVVEITLRYKTDQAIKRGSIKRIGKLKAEIGRPKEVYAKLPFDNTIEQEAKERSVVLY